jgi:hypothetical protein
MLSIIAGMVVLQHNLNAVNYDTVQRLVKFVLTSTFMHVVTRVLTENLAAAMCSSAHVYVIEILLKAVLLQFPLQTYYRTMVVYGMFIGLYMLTLSIIQHRSIAPWQKIVWVRQIQTWMLKIILLLIIMLTCCLCCLKQGFFYSLPIFGVCMLALQCVAHPVNELIESFVMPPVIPVQRGAARKQLLGVFVYKAVAMFMSHYYKHYLDHVI